MVEDRKERVDREPLELLNEIRVVLPGAQVLFAFLLSLPFLARLDLLTRIDRDAYYAAFLCTAVGRSYRWRLPRIIGCAFANPTRNRCSSGSTGWS